MPPISEDPKDLKEKGNILFRNGDYAGAADIFRHAIRVFDQVSNTIRSSWCVDIDYE